MLTQQMASELASPFFAQRGWDQVLALAFEWRQNCQLLRELPEDPPLHRSPVLFSITKATSNIPKSLCFWQAPATFRGMHPPILAKPRAGTQAAVQHSLLQLHQQQHQMLCHFRGAQPHPQPHSSYWGLERTWETQVSTEEGGTDRKLPVPFLISTPIEGWKGKRHC